MAKLVSGRVKRTPQVSISSERYSYLSLEESEPNLGDPLVGPSSIGANPFNGGTAYVLVASPSDIGKRYWALPQTVSGIGIVTYSDTSGISTNLVSGFANIHSLSVSGVTTFSGIIPSTSTSSGALIVSGGVGIGSSLFVGRGINLNGVPLGRVGLGTDCFFVGREAGIKNTSGNYNNFFGRRAGFSNLTGSGNNIFGAYAGYENTEGNDNNFLGNFSGFNSYSGSSNNFIGKNSGYSNQDGNGNNFIGEQSGYQNTSGSNNVFIGKGAGYSNESGSNNVAIGNSARLTSPNVNNNLAIGIGEDYWVYGDGSYNVGFGSNAPTHKVHVQGAVRATDGFISVGNTTPIQITLVGNNLTFTAVGIGSTTFTLI
jgi:trimeric autotransporter adhesin